VDPGAILDAVVKTDAISVVMLTSATASLSEQLCFANKDKSKEV
jgi:hypothetical protein